MISTTEPLPPSPTSIGTSKPKHPQLAKAKLIDAGLRRLDETRRPGQTFSQAEIARRISAAETPVSKRAIQLIEAKALYNFTRRLSAACPGLLQEVVGEDTFKAVLKDVSPTRFSSSRTKAKKKFSDRRHDWTGKLTETIEILRSRRAAEIPPSFRHPEATDSEPGLGLALVRHEYVPGGFRRNRGAPTLQIAEV